VLYADDTAHCRLNTTHTRMNIATSRRTVDCDKVYSTVPHCRYHAIALSAKNTSVHYMGYNDNDCYIIIIIINNVLI